MSCENAVQLKPTGTNQIGTEQSPTDLVVLPCHERRQVVAGFVQRYRRRPHRVDDVIEVRLAGLGVLHAWWADGWVGGWVTT
jgi:hypothetical protein